MPTAWAGLMAALSAQTAVAISEQGVPTLVAFVKQDLALSAATAGVIAGAVPAGKVLGSYVAGRAVDSVGERSVLVVGAAATGALIVLAGFAPLAAAVALFVGAGVFACTPTPAGGKLVMLTFASDRRGFPMGLRQTGVPIGGLIAAVALPWLAAEWGWRTGLIAAGVLTMVGAALAMSLTGVESRSERRAVAAALRRTQPSQALHRDRDLVLITVWGVMLIAGHYVLIVFLPVYLFESGRVSLPTAALFVAVVQAGAIAGRLLWGLISDLGFGSRRRPPLLIITLLASASFLMLSLLPFSAPLTLFGIAAFLAGMSVVGWQGVWVTSISELTGPLRAGTATGFSLTFVATSTALAPPLYGVLADMTGGFRGVWLVLAATAALALGPAVAMREPADRVREREPSHAFVA